MICKAFVERLEQDYPPQAALSWDNVGLLVGRFQKEVKRIHIALDVTDEVIDEAVRQQADLLLTHHPLLFAPVKRITDEEFSAAKVMRLLQLDLGHYGMHTNYDVLRMGQLAGEWMGLKDSRPLEELPEGQGMGRIGKLREAMTLRDCCELIKQNFQLLSVRLFGNPDQVVTTAAIMPGSGKGTVATAVAQQAEVLVTGDIGHHDGLDGLEQQVAIIDAGHYGLEHIFIADMKAYLNQHFPELKITTQEIGQPFTVI